jgi:hypothetical protein
MSADIQKEAVFDDRIVQSRPRYAVEKGALSLTNAPFNSIAATASQQTFNIYVPSENVFVDRALRWSATGLFQMTVALPSGATPTPATAVSGGSTSATSYTGGTWTGAAPSPFNWTVPNYVSPGVDFSLAPFPLNYLCQTTTATINDTTSVINSQDVLLEVMRLTDYKCNVSQRTCPTMLDRFQANYLSAGVGNGTISSPINGYSEAMNTDETPNGCWGGFFFSRPDGSPLIGNGSYTDASQTGSPTIYFRSGVPVVSSNGAGGFWGSSGSPLILYWGFYSTEKITLSPFVFADDQEHDTGLFGINNIQLVMNFKSGGALSRILKTLGAQGTNTVISNIGFSQNVGGAVWTSAVMNCQFLTPSLDVPLPPKSVVPYMEFPRFITQSNNQTLAAYGTQGFTNQIQSQTITLPQIPDLLIIYVKPSQVPGSPDPLDPSFCDAYLPVASPTAAYGGIKNPLSINFDNFSGLLSSHTSEELYAMSVRNGLSMTYPQWSGLARTSVPVSASTVAAATYPGYSAGAAIPTSGGFLILKPSVDITLQSGQAPSLVGNFTLQFNLNIFNPFNFPVQPTLYVITANSGFFESIRGSSRIIKGVLSEQDIISAPVSSAQTREGLKRLVGGRVSMGAMANIFSRAKNHYEQTKPMGAPPMMPKGGAIGAGMGAGIGAGRSRKGLEARLM